tara:strand:+ start:92 stop:511 length:420 start_codon:yes stop_codon:yes gene_type:complete
MKRLLLPLLAALALPTAVNAQFVFPWNKIEPTHENKEEAMKACEKQIKRILKNGEFDDVLKTDSFDDVINGKYYKWNTKKEILTTECIEYETKDPNIGGIEGWVSWLESEFQNGELMKTPSVEKMILFYGEDNIYFPYK